MAGQKRLKAARVLCIGTGGLGSPLSLYLAAAGVGTLGLVDFDVVDVSNLQRQIIHFTGDVGRPKIDSAEEKLKAINPDLRSSPARARGRQLERAGDVRRLRRDRRRHRQLPHPLPGQRRVRPAGQAERLRLDLPVRRPGDGVLPAARAVLPMPLSRAAAAGPRAQLRRGGRAGHPAGLDRRGAGDRDGQADPGDRQAADRPALALRRARDDVPRDEGPQEPAVPDLRTEADDPRADRLPGVLRGPRRRAGRGHSQRHRRWGDHADRAQGPAGPRSRGRSSWTCAIPRRSPSAGSPARRSSPCPSCPTASASSTRSTPIVVHCKSGVRSAKAIALLQAAGFSRLKNLKGGILAWIKDVDPSLPAY